MLRFDAHLKNGFFYMIMITSSDNIKHYRVCQSDDLGTFMSISTNDISYFTFPVPLLSM